MSEFLFRSCIVTYGYVCVSSFFLRSDTLCLRNVTIYGVQFDSSTVVRGNFMVIVNSTVCVFVCLCRDDFVVCWVLGKAVCDVSESICQNWVHNTVHYTTDTIHSIVCFCFCCFCILFFLFSGCRCCCCLSLSLCLFILVGYTFTVG